MSNDLENPPGEGLDDSATPSQGSEPTSPLAGSHISAREAVRRAVAELGPGAEVDDVLAHVQAKFDLNPPRGTVQNYLSLARRDAHGSAPGEPRGRGRPRKTPGNGQQPAPPTPAVEEVIEAVEVLRDLCDRLGDDNVRRLLDGL